MALALGALSACDREKREFEAPQAAATAPKLRQSSIQAGQPQPDAPAAAPDMPSTPYRYEDNAYAVSQGKRLYRWYNCSSCHAPGGGGDWGPALSDDKWIYGSDPENIFATIAQGRPNGMPSFGGHIPEDQIWQLVAYVRSLSGQLRKDVEPGRGDALQASPPEAARPTEPVHPAPPVTGTER
ncbi:cytochrome c [Pigmentiphaga soli]